MGGIGAAKGPHRYGNAEGVRRGYGLRPGIGAIPATSPRATPIWFNVIMRLFCRKHSIAAFGSPEPRGGHIR